MDIVVSYCTDAGNRKKTNQDSLSVKVVNSPKGKIVFSVVCDGMGGLAHGELASREVVMAFNQWFETEFAQLVANDIISDELIHDQWQNVIETMNSMIGEYAEKEGTMMGTTVSVLLICDGIYYICHVGDSRIYLLEDDLIQLTSDQTLVAYEVEMGQLTEEQAKRDPRRSILLQCVGASEVVRPQYERGKIKENTSFILSSDGFVHKILREELLGMFSARFVVDKDHLTRMCENAVDLVMNRGEQDNVTVVAVALKG